MTLTQLKYAITVSEAGSMNQAAKELFISQPSLSLAIRDLEEEIGVELFRRSSRGILLTGRRRIYWICQTGRRAVSVN